MSLVLKEISGAVATVKLNRPEAFNAVNAEMLHALREVFISLRDDAAVRVVILTGSGEKAFAAGADLAAMKELSSGDAVMFSKLGHDTTRHIEALDKPVVAAVHGFALGGGMELALACDFVWASDKATFGQPEVAVGVIPGWGGTARLPRMVGLAHARDLIFSGRKVTAQDALTLGFVSRVFPHAEFWPSVTKAAEEIAAQSPNAISAAKHVMRMTGLRDLASDLDAEAHEFGNLFGGANQREGMTAFLEKRKPKFI